MPFNCLHDCIFKFWMRNNWCAFTYAAFIFKFSSRNFLDTDSKSFKHCINLLSFCSCAGLKSKGIMSMSFVSRNGFSSVQVVTISYVDDHLVTFRIIGLRVVFQRSSADFFNKIAISPFGILFTAFTAPAYEFIWFIVTFIEEKFGNFVTWHGLEFTVNV